VMIRAENVSQRVLRRYEARVYIPAGRVEEKALVWFLNAFDSYRCLVSKYPSHSSSSSASKSSTYRRATCEPAHSYGRHPVEYHARS